MSSLPTTHRIRIILPSLPIDNPHSHIPVSSQRRPPATSSRQPPSARPDPAPGQPAEPTPASASHTHPPIHHPQYTSAILLAAGVSRRMGSLKALLDWHGRPLIIHQITALRQAGADEVIVVLGHRADELQARIGANRDVHQAGSVRCVVNPHYAQGKTTSIKAGLRAISNPPHLPPGPILLLNVDQPRSAAIIRQVLLAHLNNPAALITIPTCNGKGGHPIAISRALYPQLLAITETTQGIRAVVQNCPTTTQRVELAAPELLCDINTPAQYQAALAAHPDQTR